MSFIPPIALVRKNTILKKLKACGAVSEETAMTLYEAGVINTDGFMRITEKLLNKGIIKKTTNGKYYVSKY